MATDFVHTGDLVTAVIAVLRGSGAAHTGGLPAAWFTPGNQDELHTLAYGDIADYTSQQDFLADLPAILVRGLGPASTDRGTAGSTIETQETLRIVHCRRYDQCWTADGLPERNMTKARLRYAKILGKALFNDPHKRLATIAADGTRTEATITCADTNGAQVVAANFVAWDLGLDGGTHATEEVRLLRRLPLQAWAIACDLRVTVRSG